MFYCPHIYSNYMKEIKKTIRITKKFGRLQILSNLAWKHLNYLLILISTCSYFGIIQKKNSKMIPILNNTES